MNRPLTALFASFEAALVVAIGIAIPLAPLTVLWGVQYGFALEWSTFWRASVDIWLLGHGADVRVQLEPDVAASLGLAGADAAFTLTIAALGFGLVTVLLGIRAGSRVAESTFRLLGEFVAVSTFAVLSLLASLSAVDPLARPSLVQGTLLPTAIFATGVLIGSIRMRRRLSDEAGSSLRDWFNDWPPTLRAITAIAVRGGLAVAASIISVAALVLAVMFALNFSRVVSLYEGLHTEVLGGITLTIAQIAVLPNLVIWTASWLVGPGFSIGAGSTVSPLATQLGPIPALPVFGALPIGEFAFGFVALAVPIIAGFLVAATLNDWFVKELPGEVSAREIVGAGGGIGLVSGAVLAILAAASSGAAGPGRLSEVGPDPLSVFLWAGFGVALAATAGLFAATHRWSASRVTQPGTTSSGG
ncbi:MAG: DUF6350 family protein [Microbacteriaceae bacterium]